MAFSETTLAFYDDGATLTVWAHSNRPEVLLVRTNRGATVELDHDEVVALEQFLTRHRPDDG